MLRRRVLGAGPLGLRATAALGSESETLLITALHKFAVGPTGVQQGALALSGVHLPGGYAGGYSSRGFAAGGVFDSPLVVGAAARRSGCAAGVLRQLHCGTSLLQAAEPSGRDQSAAADPPSRDLHTKAVLTGDDAGRQARGAVQPAHGSLVLWLPDSARAPPSPHLPLRAGREH